MNLFFLSRRFRRLNVPGALLVALLQRTPVVRVLVAAESAIVSSPVASVVRSTIAAVAALGAIDSMAGATTLIAKTSSNQDVSAGLNTTVGATVNVSFTVQPTDTPAQSWRVSSASFPAGLNFSTLTSTGTVNVNGSLILSGSPTAAGNYTMSITAYEFRDGQGISSVAYSYPITITGNDTAPSITTQPTDQNVAAGGNATFTVAATGSPAPTYQWRKDGNAITGATASSYSISNVSVANAGAYSVVVTNSVNAVTSSDAHLNVGPAITTQPQAQTATTGGSASFSVVATGSPTPTYQWQKGGANVAGGTGATLSLSSVTAADAGSYTVVVTNSVGAVTSSAATLTVNAAPTAPSFTQQPIGQTVLAGASVTLSATVSSSSGVTYQWKKDGVNVSNGGSISGATTASLTISSVGTGDVGNYTLVATNSVGSSTSNAAAIGIGSASNRGRIINMSVLTTVAGDETLKFGYFLGGDGTSGAKPMLMRAMGPSLAGVGVTSGTLPDPFMQFYNGNTKAAENDNWGGDASIQAAVTTLQAFPFVSATAKDAALYIPNVSMDGAHSIWVTAGGGQGGLVIAELYDATPSSQYTTATPRLINVSLLKQIGSLTTMGFFIDGSTSVKVLVRAIGPSLSAFNISGAMADPKMDLLTLDGSTHIASNNDWGGTPELVAASHAVNAFDVPLASKDAEILQTLPPGGYSVQVRSNVEGSNGVAIIEVYEVP